MPLPDFLTPFLTRIAEKVPGVSAVELTAAQVASNLIQALREYSRVAPKLVVVDISAANNYDYPLPSGWVEAFSAITRVEYPADVNQNPEDNVIPVEKYGVYQNASASTLRFYQIAPASGIIRVTYTIPHTVVTAASSVYANDSDAVCSLAAAACCFDLARRYAQDNDSFITADSVDRKTKSEKYLSLGKSLVNEYAIHFGLDKDAEVMAASGSKHWEIDYPGKTDQLTHPEANM